MFTLQLFPNFPEEPSFNIPLLVKIWIMTSSFLWQDARNNYLPEPSSKQCRQPTHPSSLPQNFKKPQISSHAARCYKTHPPTTCYQNPLFDYRRRGGGYLSSAGGLARWRQPRHPPQPNEAAPPPPPTTPGLTHAAAGLTTENILCREPYAAAACCWVLRANAKLFALVLLLRKAGIVACEYKLLPKGKKALGRKARASRPTPPLLLPNPRSTPPLWARLQKFPFCAD